MINKTIKTIIKLGKVNKKVIGYKFFIDKKFYYSSSTKRHIFTVPSSLQLAIMFFSFGFQSTQLTSSLWASYSL